MSERRKKNMTYRDQWAENENGERFIFTVEMQRRLAEAGLPVEPASLAELGERPSAPAPAPSAPRSQEAPPERKERGGNQRDDA
jgi:hypothetical protein